MKIEYLYPELGNLYGDSGNFKYLRQSLPQAEFVETSVGQRPAFLDGVDFTYCGSMTENGQAIAIEQLRPFTQEIKKALDNGARLLFTGNAMEVLGEKIIAGKEVIEGLGILPIVATRHLDNRTNGFYLGTTASGLLITGFISRGSDITADGLAPFTKTIRGYGRSGLNQDEGVVYHNFSGTSMNGPLLVLNPDYTSELMHDLGATGQPAFYQQAKKAYDKRLAEFQDPKRIIDEL